MAELTRPTDIVRKIARNAVTQYFHPVINLAQKVPADDSIKFDIREDEAAKLAAVDAFVESAIASISTRARIFRLLSIALGIVAGVLTLITIAFIVNTYIVESGNRQLDAAIVSTIQLVTFSVLSLALVWFLIGVSRSLFKDAERLYDKRHRLRMGRLYVHLTQGDINLSHLEEIFRGTHVSQKDAKNVSIDLPVDIFRGTHAPQKDTQNVSIDLPDDESPTRKKAA